MCCDLLCCAVLSVSQGPLPLAWMEQQRDLQIKILKRMREFGMRPVLPAFSGLVPPAMSSLYPNANIVDSSGWVGFPPTQVCPGACVAWADHMAVSEPHGSAVPRHTACLPVAAASGVWHRPSLQLRPVCLVRVFNGLLTWTRYNEMAPYSMNTGYLSNSTAAVYAAMTEADPEAVWILQGWMFVNSGAWNASTVWH
jgi:alpha-N-acetylglucosaminidase